MVWAVVQVTLGLIDCFRHIFNLVGVGFIYLGLAVGHGPLHLSSDFDLGKINISGSVIMWRDLVSQLLFFKI